MIDCIRPLYFYQKDLDGIFGGFRFGSPDFWFTRYAFLDRGSPLPDEHGARSVNRYVSMGDGIEEGEFPNQILGPMAGSRRWASQHAAVRMRRWLPGHLLRRILGRVQRPIVLDPHQQRQRGLDYGPNEWPHRLVPRVSGRHDFVRTEFEHE